MVKAAKPEKPVPHTSLLTASGDGVHIVCSCGWDEALGNFHSPNEAFTLWMNHILKSAFNQILTNVEYLKSMEDPHE